MKPIRKSNEAAGLDRERLVELIVREMDRTFSTEGHKRGLEALGDMLRNLDPQTLHALAYRLELDVEAPAEEPERGERPGP